jgi:hypothetical protein
MRDQGAVTNLQVAFVTSRGRQVPMLVSAARFVMDRRDYMVINARDVSQSERARLEREAILNNASIGIAVTRDSTLCWPTRTSTRSTAGRRRAGGPARPVVWPSDPAYEELSTGPGAGSRGEPVEFEAPGAGATAAPSWPACAPAPSTPRARPKAARPGSCRRRDRAA